MRFRCTSKCFHEILDMLIIFVLPKQTEFDWRVVNRQNSNKMTTVGDESRTLSGGAIKKRARTSGKVGREAS